MTDVSRYREALEWLQRQADPEAVEATSKRVAVLRALVERFEKGVPVWASHSRDEGWDASETEWNCAHEDDGGGLRRAILLLPEPKP